MSNKEKMPKTVNERVQKYRVSLSEEKKAIVRAKDNMAYLQCVSSGDLPKYVYVQKTSHSRSIYMVYPQCVFSSTLPE